MNRLRFKIGEVWWLFAMLAILAMLTFTVNDMLNDKRAKEEAEQEHQAKLEEAQMNYAETMKTAIIYPWEIEEKEQCDGKGKKSR